LATTCYNFPLNYIYIKPVWLYTAQFTIPLCGLYSAIGIVESDYELCIVIVLDAANSCQFWLFILYKICIIWILIIIDKRLKIKWFIIYFYHTISTK
jgi:hypothetical protein